MNGLRTGLISLWAVWSALATALAAGNGPSATLEFSTRPVEGKYSPKHVLAVWVCDADNHYLKTLQLNAAKRKKYLSVWQAARGTDQPVDGVSGATLTQHKAHKVVWDGTDAKGQPVPDGRYRFVVEYTSHHAAGPTATFEFIKGPKAETREYPATDHFANAKVTFSSGQ
jgi:hypothetical protein